MTWEYSQNDLGEKTIPRRDSLKLGILSFKECFIHAK